MNKRWRKWMLLSLYLFTLKSKHCVVLSVRNSTFFPFKGNKVNAFLLTQFILKLSKQKEIAGFQISTESTL